MSGEQISCEREKEVIWDEVRRCRNADTQGWGLFQTGFFLRNKDAKGMQRVLGLYEMHLDYHAII